MVTSTTLALGHCHVCTASDTSEFVARAWRGLRAASSTILCAALVGRAPTEGGAGLTVVRAASAGRRFSFGLLIRGDVRIWVLPAEGRALKLSTVMHNAAGAFKIADRSAGR